MEDVLLRRSRGESHNFEPRSTLRVLRFLMGYVLVLGDLSDETFSYGKAP
jgi:hypothetical protein